MKPHKQMTEHLNLAPARIMYHDFEWQFYTMWGITNLLLAGLFYVAVEHL